MVNGVLKFLTGAFLGGAGGVFVGKYLERVSNEYVLDATSHDKFTTFDWVKKNDVLSSCTKEERDTLIELLSKMAQARTIEDTEKYATEIDNFLEDVIGIKEEYKVDDNEKEVDKSEPVENKDEDKKDVDNNNETAGKASDKTKPEDIKDTVPEENKSKKVEPVVQSQEDVQVKKSDTDKTGEKQDETKKDELIEIKDLGKAIDAVTKGCVGKDLINRYVQYVAAIEDSDVDAFFELLTELSNDIHNKNEEGIVRRIYEFADVKSKLKK